VVKGRTRGPFVARAVRQALERHRVRRDVPRLALVDDLTGLGNRRAFLAVGGHRIKLSRRTGEALTLLAIALRRSSEPPTPNGDGPAAAAVDHVLRDAATLLRETLRESDVVSRLGGDLFAVLVTGDEHHARGLLQRLIAAVHQHDREAGRSFRFGFHAALVLFDRDRHLAIDDLLAEVPRLGPDGAP
jgi:diguanylate cyclase (GGDEF)-like protein